MSRCREREHREGYTFGNGNDDRYRDTIVEYDGKRLVVFVRRCCDHTSYSVNGAVFMLTKEEAYKQAVAENKAFSL